MTGDRWYFDPVECRIVDTSQEPRRQWVSTRAALEHLRSVGLSPGDNRDRLVRWAAAGLLPARALFLRDHYGQQPEGSLIPKEVWKSVAEGLWVRSFDWDAGSLRLLRLNLGSTLDVEAHGIEFDQAALLRLAPEVAPEEAEIRGPSERPIGRPLGSGRYSRTDESLFPRVQELIDERKAANPSDAARQLFAEGELTGAAEQSAITRLVRGFYKWRRRQ